MGLAKQITKSFVKMVKDSGRIQKSVDQMKDKVLSQGINVLKEAGIDPASLPFDPVALLSGDIPDPQSILTPENVCSVPPLNNNQKNKANIAIEKNQNALGGIIENTNKLKSALVDIQGPISSIQTTGENVEGLVTSLDNSIKVIKAIPIPVAFGAPAVSLPVKVLTILSSIILLLDKKLVIAKGTVGLIGPQLKQVSGVLNTTISSVNKISSSLEPALVLNSFVKSVVDLGDSCPIVTQEEIDQVNNSTNQSLQDALNSSGDNVSLLENQLTEEELIASFPFEYKGFLLELVNNPNNDFPFSSRKIRGTRDFTGQTETKNTIFVRTKFNTPLGEVILYNDPGGQARYSYSTSVAVLVKEMKFKLDNYLNGVNELALPAITEAGGGRVGRNTTPPNPNPQVFTPPSTPIGGSDDPPSPTGSVTPTPTPAYIFPNANDRNQVSPTKLVVSGSFTAIRPIKVKMTTFGGTFPLDGESRAFLRIYKQGIPGYSFMMEDQYAEMQQTITTKDNPAGYYYDDINAPEYWPINPGYANGSVASNLGIFSYVLTLNDYTGNADGSSGNFAKFEIEAQ
jgi:hypothetical protein